METITTCSHCEEGEVMLRGHDEHNGAWGLCEPCVRDLVDSGEWVNQGGHVQRAIIRVIDSGVLD